MKRNRIGPLASAILFACAPLAMAHERDTFKIGNRQYIVTVGSLNERIMVDKISGVDFRVSEAPGAPVVGLDQTLKVELNSGNKKATLAFDPMRNAPASYAPN